MRLFIILLELVVLLGVAAWLSTQPGSISLEWAGTHIESSLSLGFLALVSLFLVLALIFKLWHFIVMLPSRFYAYTQKLRPEKGIQALTQSVISSALEEYDEARSEAQRFERYLGENAVYKALMASSYIQQGRYEDARKITETMKNDGDSKTLSWIIEAQSALREGKDVLAQSSLQGLLQLHERSPWVIRNLLKCSLNLKLYDVSLEVLKKAERADIFPSQTIKRFRATIYYQQAMLTNTNLEQKESLLEKAHKLAPELVKVTVQYSKVLRLMDNPKRARKAIEQTWALHPHADLLDEYLSIDPETDPKAAMKSAAKLISFNERHRNSYLSMARYALKMQEWGKARAALNSYQEKYEMTPEACHMMARLELSEHTDHTRYREWMERALQVGKDLLEPDIWEEVLEEA